MEGGTGRSDVQRFASGKAEQGPKIVRRDRDGQKQKGVEMDGRERLEFNRWWRRGEEVLRRSQ